MWHERFEFVKSPGVTLCGWWGYKPSRNNSVLVLTTSPPLPQSIGVEISVSKLKLKRTNCWVFRKQIQIKVECWVIAIWAHQMLPGSAHWIPWEESSGWKWTVKGLNRHVYVSSMGVHTSYRALRTSVLSNVGSHDMEFAHFLSCVCGVEFATWNIIYIYIYACIFWWRQVIESFTVLYMLNVCKKGL